MLAAICERLRGQATWTSLLGEWRGAFLVKFTDTGEQRTANDQNQQACSKNMLAVGPNDQPDLRLHCVLLPVENPAKARTLGIRNLH